MTEAPTAAPTPYDRKFFDGQGSGSSRSAELMLSMVIDWLRPQSIIDVGCGEAHWLAAAYRMGVSQIHGLDGDYVDRSRLAVPPDRFTPTDLSQPFESTTTFDLAISMEVAEHLDPSTGPTFVHSLTRLAPAVLFSAAIPGQGGTDHRNERWQSYWATLFAEHRYICFDALRPKLWNDDRVEVWYRQNAMLFLHETHFGTTLSGLRACRVVRPMDIVHPNIFTAAQHRLERRLYWAEHPGMRTACRSLVAAALRRLRGSIQQ